MAGTAITYHPDYYAAVRSCLWRPVTEQCMSSGEFFAYPRIDGVHPTFYAISNETYCVDSRHGIWYFGYYYQFSTGVCHTFPIPPPTPTPTPTPDCEPLAEGALPPCVTPTPTPTPNPLPSPSASIVPIDVVEKNGTKDIVVSVSNNSGGTTKFTIINPTTGTGRATFADDSTELNVNGNVVNQPLTIKGVVTSNQADNITIQAKLNTSDAIAAQDAFTVGEITSLVFERIRVPPGKSPDFPLDENPGIDGVANPDGNEGQRIFPDKNTAADPFDRSVLRVKATVSTVLPNVQVYFGSHDLDDPSANLAPIDANGNTGNDNNGVVNGSRSGDFTVPAGFTCQTPPSGPVPGQISCTIGSDGTSAAAFKTTMQPGDNFAVAASLNDQYRNVINLGAMDGSILTNAANQTIPISGASNPDNVAGLRTRMITVWRKLHIEVDSMGQAQDNYARENVSGSTTIAYLHSKALNLIAAGLEVNRFQNGRMELAGITNVLDVTANTANSVTVTNSTSSNIVLANNVNFEISSQSGVNSAIGTIPTGQTITPMQTVTLNVSGTPLPVNLFSNGQMFITPVLRSLAVTSNTATSVTVTNNGRGSIAIADATHIRLYDDDDMDNQNPTNSGSALNGDEGEDVAAPDTSLLTDNSSNPANNVFAPAYIVPRYDLGQSDSDVVFNPKPTWPQIGLFLNSPYFHHLGDEARSDFWTIYLLGGYQPPTYSQSSPPFVIDGDPVLYNCGGGNICTTYGASNSGSSDTTNVRNNIGQGAILFAEVGRPHEYPPNYLSRPISRAYTTVHEVGHLFRGLHIDGDLMAPSLSRTVGTFSDTSLSIIRGTTHP